MCGTLYLDMVTQMCRAIATRLENAASVTAHRSGRITSARQRPKKMHAYREVPTLARINAPD
eukprot:745910-Pleurochrysis_carterae.AAC.1